MLFDEPIESAELLLFSGAWRRRGSRRGSPRAGRRAGGQRGDRLLIARSRGSASASARTTRAAALLEDDGRGPSLRFHVDMPVLFRRGRSAPPAEGEAPRADRARGARGGVHVIAWRIARARRVQLDLVARPVGRSRQPAGAPRPSLGGDRPGVGGHPGDRRRAPPRGALAVVPASGEAAMTRASRRGLARAAADRGAAEEAGRRRAGAGARAAPRAADPAGSGGARGDRGRRPASLRDRAALLRDADRRGGVVDAHAGVARPCARSARLGALRPASRPGAPRRAAPSRRRERELLRRSVI